MSVSKHHEVDPRFTFHPVFNSPDADVILCSSEGTLYRVPSYTLRTTSGLFRTMLELPQGASTRQDEPIPIDEKDKVLERLLRMISGLEIPRWESYEDVESVISIAENWDATGPLAIIRSAITAPLFLADPLRLYAIAAHFGWEEEAKLASKHSLTLSIYDKEHQAILQRIPPKPLLTLLNFHRRRRDEFKALIDSQEQFNAGNSNPNHCSGCGHEVDNHTWRELKTAMVSEMDRRPLGDTLVGMEMDAWPEAVACWGAKCTAKACGKLNYHKNATLADIKRCLDSLPLTI